MTFKTTLYAIAAAITLVSSAGAATLTTNTLTGTSTYDFSDGPSVFTEGPVTRAIGGMSFEFNSSVSHSVFDYDGGYGLNGNGVWTSARNGYAGLNADAETMTFEFSQAVAGVGGLINYADPDGYADAVLEIFDVGGGLLESFNLTQDAAIDVDGNDMGAFRGFDMGANVIGSFALSGAFIVIDDLVISQQIAPVPLPAGMPLLAAGLAGLALWRRKSA